MRLLWKYVERELSFRGLSLEPETNNAEPGQREQIKKPGEVMVAAAARTPLVRPQDFTPLESPGVSISFLSRLRPDFYFQP
jgi:hypothetical protein